MLTKLIFQLLDNSHQNLRVAICRTDRTYHPYYQSCQRPCYRRNSLKLAFLMLSISRGHSDVMAPNSSKEHFLLLMVFSFNSPLLSALIFYDYPWSITNGHCIVIFVAEGVIASLKLSPSVLWIHSALFFAAQHLTFFSKGIFRAVDCLWCFTIRLEIVPVMICPIIMFCILVVNGYSLVCCHNTIDVYIMIVVNLLDIPLAISGVI